MISIEVMPEGCEINPLKMCILQILNTLAVYAPGHVIYDCQ